MDAVRDLMGDFFDATMQDRRSLLNVFIVVGKNGE